MPLIAPGPTQSEITFLMAQLDINKQRSKGIPGLLQHVCKGKEKRWGSHMFLIAELAEIWNEFFIRNSIIGDG